MSSPFTSAGCKQEFCQSETSSSSWGHLCRLVLHRFTTPVSIWFALCSSYLALSNTCFIQTSSSTFLLISQTFRTYSFKHISQPPLDLVSLLTLPFATTFPEQPDTSRLVEALPQVHAERKTSEPGAFYKVRQTKSRHCQMSLTHSMNNCFLSVYYF